MTENSFTEPETRSDAGDETLSMRPESLTLVMMAGLPGSGKSMLSLALGHALGWPVVDKDLFDAVLRAAVSAEASPTDVSYDLMFALANDLLVEQQISIILDCPSVIPQTVERARQLASTAEALFKVVLCVAPQELRNQRMAASVPELSRAWRHPARRRPSDIVRDGLDQFRHLPSDTLVADTTQPQEDVVRDLLVAFCQ